MIFIRHAFAIEESMLPNLVSPDVRRLFSMHDIGGFGVQYLVGVCLNTGNILFLSDQLAGGKRLERVIYEDIKSFLNPWENIVASNAMGFNFRNEIKCLFCPPSEEHLGSRYFIKDKIEDMEERIAWNKIGIAPNKEFDRFGCLKQTFRHELDLQGSVFKAVAFVVQVMKNARVALQ